MSEPKWHYSPTQAGRIGGPWHYDIGADDNENIALVYPAEDGPEVTAERAKLICEARETKRQRDRLLEAANRLVNPPRMQNIDEYVADSAALRAAIAAAEGDGG